MRGLVGGLALVTILAGGACTSGRSTPGASSGSTAIRTAEGGPALPTVKESGVWSTTAGTFVAIVLSNTDPSSTAANVVISYELLDASGASVGGRTHANISAVPAAETASFTTILTAPGVRVAAKVDEVEAWISPEPLGLKVEGARRLSAEPAATRNGLPRGFGRGGFAGELVSTRSAPAAVNVHCLLRDAENVLRGGKLTTLLDVEPGSRRPFTVDFLHEIPTEWTCDFLPQIAPVRRN